VLFVRHLCNARIPLTIRYTADMTELCVLAQVCAASICFEYALILPTGCTFLQVLHVGCSNMG
jgi:hypothetical protein